jgi:hypothetical protein
MTKGQKQQRRRSLHRARAAFKYLEEVRMQDKIAGEQRKLYWKGEKR